MKTTENNKLIAEFMGFTPDYLELRNEFTTGGLKYHTDWNWLMPVVEKIQKLQPTESVESEGKNKRYVIDHWLLENPNKLSKIEATYKAVIEFINWYNTQKK